MAIKNLINGKFVDELAAHDRGLHYGDGLFETITVENMQLLCWDEHLKRLERGCTKLNIAVPDKNLLKNEFSKLIYFILGPFLRNEILKMVIKNIFQKV